ncbi:hypothetical protein [Baaleninema simplex]|uniref:hypothetical protein n=1 Tax=Baaleninema simplex TaxID=2862350 RepID=UPI000349269E|nr:hypothetical protein [Baaleninema simplex]
MRQPICPRDLVSRKVGACEVKTIAVHPNPTRCPNAIVRHQTITRVARTGYFRLRFMLYT